jgi:hypothetical protein
MPVNQLTSRKLHRKKSKNRQKSGKEKTSAFDYVAEEVARRMRAGKDLSSFAMMMQIGKTDVWRKAEVARQLGLLFPDDYDESCRPASVQRLRAELSKAKGKLVRLQRLQNMAGRMKSDSYEEGCSLRAALAATRRELCEKMTLLQSTEKGLVQQAIDITVVLDPHDRIVTIPLFHPHTTLTQLLHNFST